MIVCIVLTVRCMAERCEIWCFVLVCSQLMRDTIVGFFFFQAEDGIRDLVRSRGLGDVYKRQAARRRT